MPQARLELFRKALEFAQRQVANLVDHHHGYFPIYTVAGKWHHRGELWTDWTGGFLTGQMWLFYRLTGDACWRECAEYYCSLLERRKTDRAVHDLGFIFLNSFLPWYEVSGNPAHQQVVLDAGRTLAMRFQDPGGYLCSFVGPQSLFVDIMMNVPIIVYTAQVLADEALLRVALAHCRTTRDTLVREDGSTAHEGLFDNQTGRFLRQSTHQGLAPESTWARGLAWSMYGFSKVFALTKLNEFLEVAERNARYWIEHLPSDHIPYWDFHADLDQPPPWGAQKDSSAAAIAASALLDLAGQSPAPDRASLYRAQALATLEELAGPRYLARDIPGWEGTLQHAVYHTRKNLGVDESVMWGDYFFVEALAKAPNTQAAPASADPPADKSGGSS